MPADRNRWWDANGSSSADWFWAGIIWNSKIGFELSFCMNSLWRCKRYLRRCNVKQSSSDEDFHELTRSIRSWDSGWSSVRSPWRRKREADLLRLQHTLQISAKGIKESLGPYSLCWVDIYYTDDGGINMFHLASESTSSSAVPVLVYYWTTIQLAEQWGPDNLTYVSSVGDLLYLNPTTFHPLWTLYKPESAQVVDLLLAECCRRRMFRVHRRENVE